MHATTTKKHYPQHFNARINDWKFRREVKISEDQVGLQVTIPSCNHCSTCQRRSRSFRTELARRPEQIHQWRFEDGAEWIYLPLQPDQNALQLLRDTLGVSVSQ